MRLVAPISAALVWSVAMTCSLGGCKDDEPPVYRFACRCDFLTDMDDASEQRVEVCARDQARAQQRAVGCAQSGAPATIQRCACEPAAGSPAGSPSGASATASCNAGDCKVYEFR